MWDFSDSTTQTARKDYNCDASDWLREECFEDLFHDCSIEELAEIKSAQEDGWKIKKGQQYERVRGKWEGEWSTFRCRPGINAICQRLDLYRG